MVTLLMLALSVATPDSPERHVRATDPAIQVLIDAGLLQSETFRRLVRALDQSDVIVYIEPKRLRRRALRGYLSHNVVVVAHHRYLRIAVETQGPQRGLVSLLAHELQHAVEISLAPDARDAETMRRTFEKLALKFGCGDPSGYETLAAKNVEHIVNEELAAQPPLLSSR